MGAAIGCAGFREGSAGADGGGGEEERRQGFSPAWERDMAVSLEVRWAGRELISQRSEMDMRETNAGVRQRRRLIVNCVLSVGDMSARGGMIVTSIELMR